MTDGEPRIGPQDTIVHTKCQNLGFYNRTVPASFHAHHFRLVAFNKVASSLSSLLKNCFCNRVSDLCPEYECNQPVYCYRQDLGCLTTLRMPVDDRKLADFAKNMVFAAKRIFNPQNFHGQQTQQYFHVCFPISYFGETRMEQTFQKMAEAISTFHTWMVIGNGNGHPPVQQDQRVSLPVVLGMCHNFSAGTSLLTARNLLQGTYGLLWDLGIILQITLALVPFGQNNRLMLRCLSKAREKHGGHWAICQNCFHQSPRVECDPSEDFCPVCHCTPRQGEVQQGPAVPAVDRLPEPVRAVAQNTPPAPPPAMLAPWANTHLQVALPPPKPLYSQIVQEEASNPPINGASPMAVLGHITPGRTSPKGEKSKSQGKDQQTMDLSLAEVAERLSQLEFAHPKHCYASVMAEGFQLWSQKIHSLDQHREDCERFRSQCSNIQLFNPPPQKRQEIITKEFQAKLSEFRTEVQESMRQWTITMERRAASFMAQIPSPAVAAPEPPSLHRPSPFGCRFCKHCRLKGKKERRGMLAKRAVQAQPTLNVNSPSSPCHVPSSPIPMEESSGDPIQPLWRLTKRSKSESELKEG